MRYILCLLITSLFLFNYTNAEFLDRTHVYYNKTDGSVLKKIPKSEKYLLLNKNDDIETYKELGKKYKTECEEDNNAVSCYLISRLTSDFNKQYEYMEHSCAIGTLVEACIAYNEILKGNLNDTIPLNYGRCKTGYSLAECRKYFFNAYGKMFKAKSNMPLGIEAMFERYFMDELVKIQEFRPVLKKDYFSLNDDDKFALNDYLDKTTEMIENLNTNNNMELANLHKLLSFVNIILDKTNDAVHELGQSCKISDYNINNCTNYFNALKDELVPIEKEDIDILINLCKNKHYKDVCIFTLSLLKDDEEKNNLKLSVCKLNKNTFPDCSSVIDGF